METMSYDMLIPHLAANTVKAIRENNVTEAQKICFTLIQEAEKFDSDAPELVLFKEAFASIDSVPNGNGVYLDMFIAHQRHRDALAGQKWD